MRLLVYLITLALLIGLAFLLAFITQQDAADHAGWMALGGVAYLLAVEATRDFNNKEEK